MTNKHKHFMAEDDEKQQVPEPENAEQTEKIISDDEIEKLQAENAKLKDAFLRAYAEAENVKKRCQQEIEKNSKYAVASFAKEMLGVADNLQRAVTSVDEEHRAQYQAVLEGVEMTQKELTHVFSKFGVQKIECMGKIFDPNFERVVQEIEDTSKPSGTIISELQAGYMINDRILREAMVIVTKGGK
ncbi:MAG: nucleotide exchange factor GrpE [Alphaproteobacteria bacterium]|nr:nucleotide exchange factor GrpE [Alphaproteobacteria bacterium]